jgi:hypothetical protein
MMFCKHCGAKLKEGGKFCEACGKPRDFEGEHPKNVSEVFNAKNKDKAEYDQKLEVAQSVNSGESHNSSNKESPALDKDGNVSNDKEGSPAMVITITVIVAIVLVGILTVVFGGSNSPQSPSTTVSSTDNAVSAAATTTSSASKSLPTVSQQNTQPISQGSQSASANTNSDITTSFINQIEPAIALVVCFPPDYSTSGNLDYGSGISVNYGGTTYIETNYHVYNAENTGGGSPSCLAYYPGPAPDFSITSQSGGYQLTLYSDHYNPNTSEDVADFTLGSSAPSSAPLASIPVINNTSLTGIGSGCSNVNSGDSVTIFGYPASGNYLNISETVTQGTISGQNPGPIYKFDGAIDHGNSGGLAVLDKSNCDLGIPTLGVSGLTAGTGYIQSISLSRQNVTLTNDQICQGQYGINSDYTGDNNSQGGLICGCSSGYTWNTGNTACVAVPPESGYQVCSAAFPNETWDGTYSSEGKYNCVCDSGYSMYNNQCVSGYTYCTDKEGYGANYDSGTNSCTCDAGYAYSNGQCTSIDQICQNDVGSGSYYLGYNNPDGTYACSNPY